MKTLWEINWHYLDEEQEQFSHCTVTPIDVLREGVLPGCSGVSITAKDSTGHTFQGVPRDYFETEAAAWNNVRQDLAETIEANEALVKFLKEENHRMFSFLITLPDMEKSE